MFDQILLSLSTENKWKVSLISPFRPAVTYVYLDFFFMVMIYINVKRRRWLIYDEYFFIYNLKMTSFGHQNNQKLSLFFKKHHYSYNNIKSSNSFKELLFLTQITIHAEFLYCPHSIDGFLLMNCFQSNQRVSRPVVIFICTSFIMDVRFCSVL